MSRRRDKHHERKLQRGTNTSYRITLPVELIRELKWRDGQKLVVSKKGNGLFIADWE